MRRLRASWTNVTTFRLSRFQSAPIGNRGTAKRVGPSPDFASPRHERSDDGNVREHAAMIFPPSHVRLQLIFRNRDHQLVAIAVRGLRKLRRRHGKRHGVGAGRLQFDLQPPVRSIESTLDRAAGPARVAADELGATVDDELGRVDRIDVEDATVDTLPVRHRGGRKSISPPELIPVIDMQPERDDFGAFDRLRCRKRGEQTIGRRTAGAAFRREQLDDDWRRLTGVFARSSPDACRHATTRRTGRRRC